MVMERVAELRTELEQLNLKCQTARDNEVRYALQRSRLEAERTQLLVKLMEAVAQSTPQQINPTAPYRVTMTTAPALDLSANAASGLNKPEYSKPDGIPTMSQMIEITLKGVGDGLKPKQIINQIKREWWPDMPNERVHQGLFRGVRKGHLQKDGNRYKLIRAAKSNGVDTGAQLEI
jgi:hypothetical protein